jgi:hypothetical protein
MEFIMPKVVRVLVSEALVVEDRPKVQNCPDQRNVAHIDLIMEEPVWQKKISTERLLTKNMAQMTCLQF